MRKGTVKKGTVKRKNRINMLNMLNMLNQKNKKTKPSSKRVIRSYFIDPLIAQSFADYCRSSKILICEGLERAMIEYMRSHPPPQTQITIIQPQQVDLTVIDKVELKVNLLSIKNFLYEQIEALKVAKTKQDLKLFFDVVANLKKALPEAKRVYQQTEDPSLEKLIDEVNGYL